ncbi:nucleoside deaminase [Chitinimonas sp. PSY-7]|uniref:nucleoside deaminase n=1 Tax=Chitinimonas sp. PSY-7 TaxID=3459088 RepID=UPI0040402DB7
MTRVIDDVNTAAAAVLDQATAAANQTTFAVGGVMVNNMTGEVISAIHNNVITPLSNNVSFTFDPTAHGERQLVYWYYANKDALKLPEPNQITVVTSLDPCAMCTGALLTAGFNVGVVAIDTYAGINCAQNFQFATLPPNLRTQAQKNFGYYASGPANSKPLTRPYVGGASVAFKNGVVTPANLRDCGTVFTESVDTVRNTSNSTGLPPSQMSDPAKLPSNSPILQAYREIYNKAFTIKVDNPRLPDAQILAELKAVLASAPNARNAVAFIDPFGNLVLCMADAFNTSPVHAAFMNVTQGYAKTRWELMNKYVQAPTTENPALYLTHPKYGTFVYLYAPDPDDSITIMSLGAYGSTMEGAIPNMFPSNLQFYYPPRNGAQFSELVPVVNELPPFYTQNVNISLMQVPGVTQAPAK